MCNLRSACLFALSAAASSFRRPLADHGTGDDTGVERPSEVSKKKTIEALAAPGSLPGSRVVQPGPSRASVRFPTTLYSSDRSEVAMIRQSMVKFLRNEDGPTAVEYAVMLALIIVVCLTAIAALGSNTNNTFSYVGSKVGSMAGS
jgi:pilus assembly protein Flp/PilA